MSIKPEFDKRYHSTHHNKVEPYQNAQRLLSLPRGTKRTILLLADFAASVICLFFALSLRYGYIDNHISPIALCLYALPPIIGLYLIGFYKSVARIFFDAVMRNVLQLFVVLIFFYQALNYIAWATMVPRSVPIFYLFIFFIYLWNSRLLIKELLERSQGGRKRKDNTNTKREKVVIYGAGSAGKELFDALRRSHKYYAVAFIDDNLQLVGGYLLGKKIYGPSEIVTVAKKLNVAQVFLAIPSISRSRRLEIIDELAEVAIKIKQLPSLHEIADEKVSISTMRAVDILDVLDRQTVEPDATLLSKNIAGKHVLVTGAGGSIGSELCRQIIKNQPKCLILYELSEYALYKIDQELLSYQIDNPKSKRIRVISIIGSVTNEQKLLRIFESYRVQTVYHAAAYKHVPIVEHNPFEGVINNSKGTYHCARAAMRARVETFVLISTDKAVRPTNIMGASKRLAELVCQGLSHHSRFTCFSMVRFGNVLGSSGSVIPLFTNQIERGGPITVTHPDVTRYFMTIPEAASLVIQAGAMAKGSEVYVLDMGQPIKIIELAKRMIFLTGCQLKNQDNPEGDIEIVITGLRPGEKLYEELIIDKENIEVTDHPLIRQAIEHSVPLTHIESMLSELVYKAAENDVHWLKQEFRYFVEGYQENTYEDNMDSKHILPAGTNIDLVSATSEFIQGEVL